MESAKKSSALIWLLALVFTVITVGMMFYVPEWFWVPLPFMLTFIVQGFRAM
ncbi:MAG TPA: hypothetical protein PKC40_00290 [Saprospiraceae bacterium]|nr:hypothetical protein [Saprospiraceae bacterium]